MCAKQAVKPYTELTFTGKLRRLRRLAEAALAQYDLPYTEIAYHCFDTNLLWRVTAASGERFMLRLASPGWRTFEDLQAEALWLEALARETTVAAPRVVRARSGEYVLQMSHPDIPQVRNATLMSWVPGRLLGHYLTPRNLEKMGSLFAALHLHGAAWTPPAGFSTLRFEHWLSRGEENRLTGEGQSAEALALPAQSRAMLERLDRHVEAAYAALDRRDLRVIHCDLWHDNIRLHNGILHPFDFEDTVWGFRAHDIAMAMLDLLESTDEARYAVLLRAFREGYAARLDWPEDRIETFQIGRLLWKLDWIACYQPQRLASMVEQHLPVLEHYEQTGEVIQPPKM